MLFAHILIQQKMNPNMRTHMPCSSVTDSVELSAFTSRSTWSKADFFVVIKTCGFLEVN